MITRTGGAAGVLRWRRLAPLVSPVQQVRSRRSQSIRSAEGRNVGSPHRRASRFAHAYPGVSRSAQTPVRDSGNSFPTIRDVAGGSKKRRLFCIRHQEPAESRSGPGRDAGTSWNAVRVVVAHLEALPSSNLGARKRQDRPASLREAVMTDAGRRSEEPGRPQAVRRLPRPLNRALPIKPSRPANHAHSCDGCGPARADRRRELGAPTGWDSVHPPSIEMTGA
jgi:hypothetical protein